MLNQGSKVLVSGATGLIGGEFVRGLMRREVDRVWALVRPKAGAGAGSRLRERLARSDGLHHHSDADLYRPLVRRRSRRTAGAMLATSPEEFGSSTALLDENAMLEAVPGDVSRPRWGLSPRDFREITQSVDMIVHCAAETSFARDRDCRQTNVEGMANLIDLARQCERNPLIVYVGTACNVGKVAHRCIKESEGCQVENNHHNEYTRTKAVAEYMLYQSGLPILVLRPSIVLSEGIEDATFARAILWVFPLAAEFACVPLDGAARLDIVPVSFVVDAALELMSLPERRYDCYHLSAGADQCATVEELVDFCNSYYQRPEPLRLMPPPQWSMDNYRRYVRTDRQRKLFFALRYYLPFCNMDVVFDNARLREELGGHRLDIRPATSYLGDLLSLISMEEAVAESAAP